ncbi:hypothetical protein MMC25_007324 [Agyrium rufum]|nr:hypothetical protein [Agyrium rufum]
MPKSSKEKEKRGKESTDVGKSRVEKKSDKEKSKRHHDKHKKQKRDRKDKQTINDVVKSIETDHPTITPSVEVDMTEARENEGRVDDEASQDAARASEENNEASQDAAGTSKESPQKPKKSKKKKAEPETEPENRAIGQVSDEASDDSSDSGSDSESDSESGSSSDSRSSGSSEDSDSEESDGETGFFDKNLSDNISLMLRGISLTHPNIDSEDVDGFWRFGNSSCQVIVRETKGEASRYRVESGNQFGPDWQKKHNDLNVTKSSRGKVRSNTSDYGQSATYKFNFSDMKAVKGVAWRAGSGAVTKQLALLAPKETSRDDPFPITKVKVLWTDDVTTWEDRTTMRRLIKGRHDNIYSADRMIYLKAGSDETKYQKSRAESQEISEKVVRFNSPRAASEHLREQSYASSTSPRSFPGGKSRSSRSQSRFSSILEDDESPRSRPSRSSRTQSRFSPIPEAEPVRSRSSRLTPSPSDEVDMKIQGMEQRMNQKFELLLQEMRSNSRAPSRAATAEPKKRKSKKRVAFSRGESAS